MEYLENLQELYKGIICIENEYPGTILDRKNKNLIENQLKKMNQKLNNICIENELIIKRYSKKRIRRNIEKGIKICKEYYDGQWNSDRINKFLFYTRGTGFDECYYAMIELEDYYGEHNICLKYDTITRFISYDNLKKIIIDKLMELYFADFYFCTIAWDD